MAVDSGRRAAATRIEGFTPRSAKPNARPARYLKPLFIVEFIKLYRFFELYLRTSNNK